MRIEKYICTFHCLQNEGIYPTDYRIHKFANSKNLDGFIEELYKNKRIATADFCAKTCSCPHFKDICKLFANTPSY